MTGEALARALHKIRLEIPISLCTGFSHALTAETVAAVGINAYLMKPLVSRERGLAIRPDAGAGGLRNHQGARQESPEVKIIAIAGGGQMGVLDFLDVAAKLGTRRTLRKSCALQELRAAVREVLQHLGP